MRTAEIRSHFHSMKQWENIQKTFVEIVSTFSVEMCFFFVFFFLLEHLSPNKSSSILPDQMFCIRDSLVITVLQHFIPGPRYKVYIILTDVETVSGPRYGIPQDNLGTLS